MENKFEKETIYQEKQWHSCKLLEENPPEWYFQNKELESIESIKNEFIFYL